MWILLVAACTSSPDEPSPPPPGAWYDPRVGEGWEPAFSRYYVDPYQISGLSTGVRTVSWEKGGWDVVTVVSYDDVGLTRVQFHPHLRWMEGSDELREGDVPVDRDSPQADVVVAWPDLDRAPYYGKLEFDDFAVLQANGQVQRFVAEDISAYQAVGTAPGVLWGDRRRSFTVFDLSDWRNVDYTLPETDLVARCPWFDGDDILFTGFATYRDKLQLWRPTDQHLAITSPPQKGFVAEVIAEMDSPLGEGSWSCAITADPSTVWTAFSNGSEVVEVRYTRPGLATTVTSTPADDVVLAGLLSDGRPVLHDRRSVYVVEAGTIRPVGGSPLVDADSEILAVGVSGTRIGAVARTQLGVFEAQITLLTPVSAP
ncbi:MAG: hypothetical protein R3F61_34305 [Myxococcota bacterium]